MVRYLIYRPIGTCVVALTLVVLGIIVTRLLPVSLLPDIPVPEITVQASYPNADARQIQQIIAQPLRNQLLQLNHLDDLEAISNDGQVIIKLRFDYDTDVSLAYLEANEKIDILMESLPRDMQRPRVIKAGAGDIPVFQLNVQYKDDSSDFLELSNFCENVLKRRLEQLQEISFVDMTGLAMAVVLVQPNISSLQQTGATLNDLSELIRKQSGELGNVIIKDGPYEYSISFEASLRNTRDIENLYFKIGKENPRLIRLGDVAKISIQEQKPTGLYTFNGKRAIGMAVIKQNEAQLLRLRETMNSLVKTFEKDYPQLDFKISQDQTELLDLSISNLISSLITGALLSFVMILFFMKDKRILLLIGLVIPISLTITLLGFFVFGISINIVSLAGLVLGIGEIIDSAIIIIENIEQHLERQQEIGAVSISDACIHGAEEVIKPLFTSVLTNSAVFLPLLFLSGIAGALFFDQAIAVSLALGISLLTSYTFIPVMYFQFFKNTKPAKSLPTAASRMSLKLYNRVFYFAMKHPGIMVSFWVLLTLGSIWVVKHIDKRGMPAISRTELETYVNWNEPVSPQESDRRLISIINKLDVKPLETGLFVGQQQFLLNNRLHQSSTEALVIAKVNSPAAFDSLDLAISKSIQQDYPSAVYETRPALNVFEQLFQTAESPLRILLSGRHSQLSPTLAMVDSTNKLLAKNGIIVQAPPRRERIQLHVQTDKLLLYNVDAEQVIKVLRMQLNNENIGILRSDQQQIPIFLGNQTSPLGLQDLLNKSFVTNRDGQYISLKEFLNYTKSVDFAALYMGKDGSYVPLEPEVKNENVPALRTKVENLLSSVEMLSSQFTGSYYRNLSYIEDLAGIILIAVGMLFFILAAQFESLQQPFIVLLTIVFGTTGALVSLYLAGNGLNIMSAIGLIVLIGLLDNDSILKIDTMNRTRDTLSLMETIRKGGEKRLQSQLMTLLTTVLGLLPILWSSGLGAELQKPLALAVIGGMLLGVLISWTFIPLTYYWLEKNRVERNKKS
ncbi:efflux RND transporter permease subunit [Dyadobacter tibetensis]|uniref:efflux RND transporter permease subunit n=1 Tax=Dyadobacter tibetensis TaxID=1211851 RepID=UPI00046F1D8D|nr:efflux RND transporter permease subunit [Dyadobacter tibetensis]